ncbi:MAG TPA: reverse transcriptase family protein, partial [Methylomicrobium sp.]|nr:reverse transcriptase family protein [Methylomicrobium sp.]
DNKLLPANQSGIRRGHSTETAITKVLSDIMSAVDRGDTAILALLDLSAAFDTVDHSILLERLYTSFGVCGLAHDWFRSYLSGRRQHVRCGGSKSAAVLVRCGVPQGSVLGPILFILYTADLPSLVSSFGLSTHLYADDSQIYGSCRAHSTTTLADTLSRCTNTVADWMRVNRLQLNAGKTDVMWCASARRSSSLPFDPLLVAGAHVQLVSTVRDLGVLVDSDLGAASHVRMVVSRCFAALRQLRHLRRYVSDECFQTLVVALIHSRLDYGNFILVGLPAYRQRLLQSVLNAAARMVYRLRRYDHISDALATLHWLRIPERVDYKVALTAYRALHGLSPPYLDVFVRVADIAARRRLRSSASERLLVPSHRLASAGRRSFPVAGAIVWNSLPVDVQSSPSLSVFRSRLKTHLFRRSFPDILS